MMNTQLTEGLMELAVEYGVREKQFFFTETMYADFMRSRDLSHKLEQSFEVFADGETVYAFAEGTSDEKDEQDVGYYYDIWVVRYDSTQKYCYTVEMYRTHHPSSDEIWHYIRRKPRPTLAAS